MLVPAHTVRVKTAAASKDIEREATDWRQTYRKKDGRIDHRWGLALFAKGANAQLIRESDVLFRVVFPGDQYDTLIGIEGFGLMMSYTSPCGVIPSTALAQALLQKNWGGVDGTCFYLSAHFEDGKPWLFLEARQFVDPYATAEDIASMLGRWRIQWTQAWKALQ